MQDKCIGRIIHNWLGQPIKIVRKENDTYICDNLVTHEEEVLTMDNVSENEKEAINETIEWGGVLGWIEATDSKKYNKIFVQIYEGDILEVICDKKPTRSLV